MKAIIMAGGKGTRLKPLTCSKPKPMVYLANNPVMTHTIELLKKNSITELGVTLQHMASHIIEYYAEGKDYGVNFKYFIEETPLGTAGSVKNAQDFLDDTFLVISGDGLTDIDIQKAIEFHRKKKSLATLILTTVDNPLEYGIVVTKDTGEIIKFLEKPSWGEVFSDKVNTGMYILEPEVLNYIPQNTFFDFSKDLFPLLMNKGITLNGFTAAGYWCDIGNSKAYLQAHVDIITDKVSAYIPYKEYSPKVWIGKDTVIHPTAQLNPPVIVGNNCFIGPNAIVGPESIIGNNCIINEYASIKRSVLWNGVQIGKSAALRGAVLCSNVKLKKNTDIYEGAIIGEESTLNESCTIKPGAKIWPGKTISEGSVLKGNIVWGTNFSGNLFGANGIKGQLNVDFFLGQILQIGSAFGSVITSSPGSIGISSDDSSVAKTVKDVLAAGLQIVGQQVYDLGELTLPICRFAVNKGNLDGGIYIQFCSDETIQITFMDKQGANIIKGVEKKIENALGIDDYRYVTHGKIRSIKRLEDIYNLYFANLRNQVKEKLNFKVVLTCTSKKLCQSIAAMLEEVGCAVTVLNEAELVDYIKNNKIDIAIKYDEQAQKVVLFDEEGKAVDKDKFKVLLATILFDKYKKMDYVASIDEPSILEVLAQKHNNNILRCKTDLSHRMENMFKKGRYGEEQFFMEFDGIYSVVHILDYLNKKQMSLSEVITNLPPFYIYRDVLNCPWEIKGKILRSLLENFNEKTVESLEGAKFMHPQGHILILPDPEKPLVNIISESSLMEVAREISGGYKEKILSLISSNS
ncbi:MAG: sugar phosphate nucleotidyltransferase [Bacillota bacterium]